LNLNNKTNSTPPVIEFSLIYSGEEYKVKTYCYEYTDLRELIKKKLRLSEFGDCGGLGRCASCLVEMAEDNASEVPNQMACETLIDDSLSNLKIKVIGDSIFYKSYL
jgi:2Fe-2S ferredoxin